MYPVVRHLNLSRGNLKKKTKSLESKVEIENNSYNLLDNCCPPGIFHLAVLFQKSSFSFS